MTNGIGKEKTLRRSLRGDRRKDHPIPRPFPGAEEVLPLIRGGGEHEGERRVPGPDPGEQIAAGAFAGIRGASRRENEDQDRDEKGGIPQKTGSDEHSRKPLRLLEVIPQHTQRLSGLCRGLTF